MAASFVGVGFTQLLHAFVTAHCNGAPVDRARIETIRHTTAVAPSAVVNAPPPAAGSPRSRTPAGSTDA